MKNVPLTCLIVGALALPMTVFADDGAGSDDSKMNTTNPNLGKTPSSAASRDLNRMDSAGRPVTNTSKGSSTAAARGKNNAKESLDNKETAPKENRERSDAEKSGD